MTSAHVDTFVRDNLPPLHAQPEFLFDLPELKFPARLNASSLLDEACARFGDRPALLRQGGRWSYRELLAQVNRIANVLVWDLALQPGNRVLLHAHNGPMAVAIWWAILRAGGVAVSTMPLLRAGELRTIIDKAQISHAIFETSLAEAFTDASACRSLRRSISFGAGDLEHRVARADDHFITTPTSADDPALIAFTSGTTGQPKGCVHYHRDVIAMSETFSRHVVRPKPTDVFCGTPPIAFTFGLGGLMVFPAACGAATAFPASPGYDALAETIARHNVTTLFTAPTGYRALLKQYDQRFTSLRTCVSAGEHLSRATSDDWRDAGGIRLIDGIGATEMIHVFISAQGDDIRPGSTGKPVPGYQAAILDDDLNELPVGEAGRLAVRGPTGCRYLADERQANYVQGGWNITGDIFRRDEDGYFWFVSRADDMIISAGYNIAATEVESALLLHPHVSEAAVVGAADAERGQICKAFVVLSAEADASDATRSELQDFVKRAIAPYKYPRAIEFVAQLPKTHTGKLQRHKLREAR